VTKTTSDADGSWNLKKRTVPEQDSKLAPEKVQLASLLYISYDYPH
jgi:hypothetical protein